MGERADKAAELYGGGHNCAQAVLCAYADLLGMDAGQAFRLGSPFGAGLAGMRHVCGTVNAVSMITGLLEGPSSPGDRERRKVSLDRVRMFTGEFAAENGSIICRQLRGMEPGLAEGKTPKPCMEYVRSAAAIVERFIAEREKNE